MDKVNRSQYLKELLGKHKNSVHHVQKFIEGAQQNYRSEIISGKYEIRSGQQISKTLPKSDSQRNKMHNIIKIKKELNEELQLIENKMGQKQNQHHQKMTEQQRQVFVKQMIKQRKQLEIKRSQKLKQTEQKEKQSQRQEKEKKQKQEEQRRQKKKNELQEKEKMMNEARMKKKQENKSENQLLMKKMKEKLLADKMNEKFKEIQSLSLEERKKKLAEIRSLHKPLQKEDFLSHINKIQGIKRELQSQNKQIPIHKNNFYQSSWYKDLSKQPKEDISQKAQEELQQLKEMKDKQKKYAVYVRENFKPEIDESKVKEIKQKSTSNVSVTVMKSQQVREMGLKYLKISKEMADLTKKDDNSTDKNATDNLPPRYKPINYLEQLKKKKRVTASSHDFVENLKKKGNLSPSQKAQQIIQFAEKLQQKAKKREQLDKVHKNVVDEELDQLYMQAIEAKLSLLDKDF